jgi:hypothetical protein
MTTKVTIETEPAGARVTYEGKEMGTTPIQSFKMKNGVDKSYSVIIRKEGYETLQTSLKTEIKAASLVGGILILVPLLWIEGPEKYQFFQLEKEAAE